MPRQLRAKPAVAGLGSEGLQGAPGDRGGPESTGLQEAPGGPARRPTRQKRIAARRTPAPQRDGSFRGCVISRLKPILDP